MPESNVITKLSGCRRECAGLKDIATRRLSVTVTLSQTCNCAASWQDCEIASCLQTCDEVMSLEITSED